MSKKTDPRCTNRIIFPGSLETIFWVKILKFFAEDPGSGMVKIRIRDGKKSDPGSRINIPDLQHWLKHFNSVW
jgi:hypothetical protein